MTNTDRRVFAALSEFSLLRYLTRSLGCHFTTLRALNAGHACLTIGCVSSGGGPFFFLFSLFALRRFSFASQPMDHGTENEVWRWNACVVAVSRWHKDGETGFRSLHLILRRRQSSRRRRGRRAIADLTTRYHECSSKCNFVFDSRVSASQHQLA